MAALLRRATWAADRDPGLPLRVPCVRLCLVRPECSGSRAAVPEASDQADPFGVKVERDDQSFPAERRWKTGGTVDHGPGAARLSVLGRRSGSLGMAIRPWFPSTGCGATLRVRAVRIRCRRLGCGDAVGWSGRSC